jgi:beta-barrel assembly-enhancing protease
MKQKIYQTLLLITMCLVASLDAQTLLKKETFKKMNLNQIDSQVVKKAKEIEKSAVHNPVESLNPNGAISLIGDLSDEDERALGRETAGRILAVSPAIVNDSLQRYVNLIGNFVAQQSNRSNLLWTFAVIESDDINAFSAPGGYVLITSGLYRTLCNEAELAAVLGHEIAHVNLRHHVRLMQKDRLIEKGQQTLAAQTRQDAIKELAGSGAQISARAFDKKAEYECDRLGIEYAARAGYDPFAYVDALDRLGANTKIDRLSLLFKTHPHPRDRITALEKSIDTRWNSVGGVVPARWVVLEP